MVKLDSLGSELFPYSPYSSELAPRLLRGKRFHANEIISETKTYFAEFDKSYYSKGIKMLKGRWEESILLHGDHVEE